MTSPAHGRTRKGTALVLGADGYLGWPTVMAASAAGWDVVATDNYAKRRWMTEVGAEPLVAAPRLPERAAAWAYHGGAPVRVVEGDLADPEFVRDLVCSSQPDVVIHYGEQASAPYSMSSQARATETQVGNITGTLNLLFALRDLAPEAHLVKLGTMGEYGTPNIDIEEGYLEVEHKGRRDRLPYPKQPGSLYHLSKVHDSHNIAFACRVWGLRATDLNQGVVYGVATDEMVGADGALRPELGTSFHHDDVFGTVLNRFAVQLLSGRPLTVYGKGGQTRGFLDIRDTLACVLLAAENPAAAGEFRVFNQFTEQFSVLELAELTLAAGRLIGVEGQVEHLPNPRIEAEQHYYNATHEHLSRLGLQPHLLSPESHAQTLAWLQPLVAAAAAAGQDLGRLPAVTWAGQPALAVGRAGSA